MVHLALMTLTPFHKGAFHCAACIYDAFYWQLATWGACTNFGWIPTKQ